MKDPVQKTERIYFRLVAGILGGALLLALLGWGALHVFHKWQERHLVRRAAGYLSGGDLKIAALSARRAFQLNPENPDAARMLAQIAERAADGSELSWRRKVFELEPDSTDDALALVRSAMRANDLATAEKTLQAVTASGRKTPAYHAALGRLAEIRNKPDEAEVHWAKAAELAPDETAYKLQLALLQLRSVEEVKRNSARALLERLRGESKHRAAATRALIIDGASRREDPQRLRTLAEELQNYPEAAFTDRLLYAEILRQLRDPAYGEYLTALEKDAPSSPANLASLLSWLSTGGNMAEAIRFAETLDAELLAKWPVPLAVAEAYARSSDWAGLQRVLAASDWGGFEFLRHAYIARALRGEGKQLEAEQAWARAQKEASGQPQGLLLLARTVSAWDWQKETVDLLWSLSKAPDTRMEALQLLYQHYAKSGDTPGLYRVLVHSAEIAPEDVMVQNNLAQISLLLDAESERARKIAADLVRKEPSNAAYVSTYAFSLYTDGDIEGAKEALERLSEEQLQMPSIAAYYGIILAAAGEKEKARSYLERATQAFLLPEEKALIAKAENASR
ncbi:MAG: tetratricopeptide repeat protein [Chthoniobacterales bacterium]